jgi:hypothetical protein
MLQLLVLMWRHFEATLGDEVWEPLMAEELKNRMQQDSAIHGEVVSGKRDFPILLILLSLLETLRSHRVLDCIQLHEPNRRKAGCPPPARVQVPNPRCPFKFHLFL